MTELGTAGGPAISATPLKRCRIYYMAAGQDLSWAWSSEDGSTKSRDFFSRFFDCVENARTNGFYVDLERQPENLIHVQAAGRSAGRAAARASATR
jgi:hypothetical protein